MKSEPDVFSIDDLKKKKTTVWDGVRNYQARNFMRDEMKVGDQVLFYHSNATPPGVAGIMKVSKTGVADPEQFKPKSDYYDPKSKKDDPRWICVELSFVKKFKELISLDELRENKKLKDLLILRKGNRLSITPVDKKEFDEIKKMGS